MLLNKLLNDLDGSTYTNVYSTYKKSLMIQSDLEIYCNSNNTSYLCVYNPKKVTSNIQMFKYMMSALITAQNIFVNSYNKLNGTERAARKCCLKIFIFDDSFEQQLNNIFLKFSGCSLASNEAAHISNCVEHIECAANEDEYFYWMHELISLGFNYGVLNFDDSLVIINCVQKVLLNVDDHKGDDYIKHGYKYNTCGNNYFSTAASTISAFEFKTAH